MAKIQYSDDALEYIAKLADGGMRDAITLMDKCLAYSNNLTLENVVKALGTSNYDTMFDLTNAILVKEPKGIIKIINDTYSSGKDLKLFIKSYTEFILDLCKYYETESFEFVKFPSTYKEQLDKYGDKDYSKCFEILDTL